MKEADGILFFTDFHAHLFSEFAKPSENFYTDRFATQMKVLREILFEASNRHYGIIFGGDLFHKRTAVDIRVFNSVYLTFADYCDEIPFIYLLRGNHDSFDNSMGSDSSLDTFKTLAHVQVVSNPMVDEVSIQGTTKTLYFMPYGEEVDEMKATLAQYGEQAKDKDSILIAHLGIDGASQGLSSHRLASAFTLGDLHADSYELVYLGHYHYRQVLLHGYDTSRTTKKGISKKTIDTIAYGLSSKQIKVSYEEGLVSFGKGYASNGSPDTSGYYAVHIRDKENNDHKVRVHLIIAYLKYGEDLLGKQVDHINNKHGINDNTPDNLQLLTHYTNVTKEKDMTACKAYDMDTAKVTYAKSINSLADQLGLKSAAIHSALYKEKSHRASHYLIQRVGFKFNFYYLNYLKGSVPVIMHNVDTGADRQFSSVTLAAKTLGLNASGITYAISNPGHKTEGYTAKRGVPPADEKDPMDCLPRPVTVFYGGSTMQLTFNDEGQDKGYDLYNNETRTFVKVDTPKFMTFDHWGDDTQAAIDRGDYIRLQLPEQDAKRITTEAKQEDSQLLDNIRVEAQADYEVKTRLDIKADNTPVQVTDTYTKTYYPAYHDEAINIIKGVMD